MSARISCSMEGIPKYDLHPDRCLQLCNFRPRKVSYIQSFLVVRPHFASKDSTLEGDHDVRDNVLVRISYSKFRTSVSSYYSLRSNVESSFFPHFAYRCIRR